MQDCSESDLEPIYGALVISCASSPAEELVKIIVGDDVLPESTQVHDIITAYPWHIETKYYDADIHLFTTKSKDLVNADFADSVQAVVIYLDEKSPNSFKDVKSWQTFVKHFEVDVQILVYDNSCNPGCNPTLSRSFLLDWCLENNYELVELNPEVFSEDEDTEDIFKETTGAKRIVQALHAHLWPNMVMKENPSVNSTAHLEHLLTPMEAQVLASNDLLAQNEEEIVSSILADGPTSFENLFDKFQDMKEKANGLQGEDRKQYAEKVAIAFWRAMGGDEDEIDGLSSGEEEQAQ